MRTKYLSSSLNIIIFSIASLLIFPLYFTNILGTDGSIYFHIFTLSTLSSLCLGLILLNSKQTILSLQLNSELTLSILLFSGICIVHFFIFKTYKFDNFAFSIIWITIPLSIFVLKKKHSIIFQVYFIFLWLLDLAQTFLQTSEKVGIAGNRNWHAIFLITLIILSFISFKSLLSSSIVKRNKFMLSLISILFCVLWIYSIIIIYQCHSRGAWLSAICSIFIYLIFVLKELFFPKKNIINKKVISYFFIAVFCLLTVSLIILAKTNLLNSNNISDFNSKVELHNNKAILELEDAFNRDVRVPLWIATLKLIADHPLIGIGASRFETAFASYRPLSYFQKDMSATRTNHPHNVLLYILVAFGLPGFVFWAVLCIYPMFYCFSKFSFLNLFEKCSLFAYISLFIHACFDLIFYVWPTIFIGLLLLGILWRITWNTAHSAKVLQNNNKLLLQVTLSFTGIIILLSTCYSVYNETIGSDYLRKGYCLESCGHKKTALKHYNTGLKYIRPDKFIYKSALIAFNTLQNPTLSLRYFSLYNTVPTKNYAHNNGFIGVCMMQKGDFNAALPFLLKEAVNFPLSTGAWYRLSFAQKSLKLNKLAKFSYANMLNTLKYKNLPQKALKYVLENPEYDKHPNKIPKSLLKE